MSVFGTMMTACGSIFFALVKEGQSYWSYGFPSAVIVVFGADFVFSSGTLFIAKCALPHEQSVAGALFTVMVSYPNTRDLRKHLTTAVSRPRYVVPLNRAEGE